MGTELAIITSIKEVASTMRSIIGTDYKQEQSLSIKGKILIEKKKIEGILIQLEAENLFRRDSVAWELLRANFMELNKTLAFLASLELDEYSYKISILQTTRLLDKLNKNIERFSQNY